MKYLAVIQREFLKEARDWDKLTLEEQKAYMKRHPGSKRKLTARPERDSKIDKKRIWKSIMGEPGKESPVESTLKSELEQKKKLSPKEMKGMKMQQAIDSRDIARIDKKRTSLPVVNRADEVWSGLDEGKKKRLLDVFRSIKGEKEREALVNNSIGDVYRAVDNRDIEIDNLPGLSGLAVDVGDIRDFSKVLGRYSRGDYGKWPLKGNEQYIESGEDPWGEYK